jgi:3-hydroxyisobutyrate dehydrogenase-like beta-hydroxyacid dehydrogenase
VVADPPAVEGLLNRIGPVLTADHVVVQSSTIDPESSDRFLRRVAETGARYLEAPFTGSKPAAEARRLVFYLGGEERLMQEIDSTLALLSETRFAIGMPRQAAALKLAMNLQIAIMAEALAESLTFARGAGIDDDIFFSAYQKNVAWSGLAALKESKLRVRDYSPQFSVKHMHKDMRLALASVKREGNLPLTAAVKRCLEQAEASGFGDEDFIAIAKNLESHGQPF